MTPKAEETKEKVPSGFNVPEIAQHYSQMLKMQAQQEATQD